MASPTANLLPVLGATLYFQCRGSGPVLMVLQGGDGDADRTRDLVDELVSDYTVVTYDRRGLARSRLDNPKAPVSIGEHAEDVHQLLTTITDEPAFLLGSSFGALIGLELAKRHPQQVSALFAHEPPTLQLLPDQLRILADQQLDALSATYRGGGWGAALPQLAALTGAGFDDREPQVDVPEPPTGQRIADLKFFFERDLPAMRSSAFDAAAVQDLRSGPVDIIPAVGATTSADFFDRQCAVVLAQLLEVEPVQFPGGHNGLTSHPRAFANLLRERIADTT